MEQQNIWSVILGGVFTLGSLLIGAIMRATNTRIHKVEKTQDGLQSQTTDLQRRLGSHQLHAAETFARKDEIRDMRDDIVARLNKIQDKLDRSVDK